jgi:hypothetical protein
MRTIYFILESDYRKRYTPVFHYLSTTDRVENPAEYYITLSQLRYIRYRGENNPDSTQSIVLRCHRYIR